MKTTSLNNCTLIDLPKIGDRKGNVTPITNYQEIPFKIQRVYYLYDVPGGSTRAAHAHKKLQQLIVSIMGSFDVVLDDGKKKRRFSLNRAYQGLYVSPMIWREIENFSSGAVCLVLASLRYSEKDYLRDYNVFLQHKGVSTHGVGKT